MDTDAFILDGKPLKMEVEHIFFLTSFSCQGDVLNFKFHGGGRMTVDEYVVEYCISGTQKMGTHIQIGDLLSLGINIIVLTLGHIMGSATLHRESHQKMLYVVKCVNPIIYD